MPDGVRAQGVVLYVHRDFLTKHLGPDAPELPRLLNQFAGGRDDQFFFERLPVSMGMKVGFKQIVGSTISAYCQELRLSTAWRLLQETELSITQVAFEVGYEFPTNFATAFKRRYGVSPYRFRKGGTSPI